MNTKELRLAERKLWIREMARHETPEYPDVEIYTREHVGHDGKERFSLVAFSGTRGKPDLNEYYRKAEGRQERIDSYLASKKRVAEWRAEELAKNGGKRHMSTAARTAQTIREELKLKFPSVKFKVTSSNFSMGNSVDITWTDGPLQKDVDSVVSKYEYGTFDGMTDCYNMDNVRHDIPQAKYVTARREMSDETRAKLKADIGNRFACNMDNQQEVFEKFRAWPDAVIWRAFNECLL